MSACLFELFFKLDGDGFRYLVIIVKLGLFGYDIRKGFREERRGRGEGEERKMRERGGGERKRRGRGGNTNQG